ncbi:EAL domain-containing protein [Vibrio hangzhouensis]|uniref:EAL domain, c-di-GMP-specific phosphodiesterase class I (Or its enzymatically inactive variant) n=1 Tax=Vibrio hangzhouensis TaxID=462991 RepID=A0A1H6C2A8_9VIBR|nr:EAL domain-containing protein [Vibrio hangzhouensis]SEG67089.1 EAL domain, c-di-GMP-specific phosphodiesterase class I (or its enzymatically inactive variant) [Vibrio hangzhouensis]
MKLCIKEITTDKHTIYCEYSAKEYVTFEFRLQPIVNPLDYKTFAFEVLSHLVNTSGEELDNEDFFELIDDEFIKEIFLCQLHCFLPFINTHNALLSFNLPSVCLTDDVFVQQVIEVINCPIAIEITCIDSIKSLNKAKGNITKLKKSGVSLWLDDYHHKDSLKTAALQSVEWDIVKLDREYLYYDDSLEMINLLIGLVSFHCDNIILEGVESDSQRVGFLNRGVYHQGYHYCYPLSLNEAIELLDFKQIEAYTA